MKIISRKEAKSLGLKRYFTGEPCKHGHLCECYVARGCIECTKISKNDFYKNHPEQRQKENKKFRINNPGYQKEWADNNRPLTRKYCTNWRLRNPGIHAELTRLWSDKHPNHSHDYYENNKSAAIARVTKRKCQKLHATPPWLTKEQFGEIGEFYHMAKLKELLTGQKFHVDHIHPLQGKTSAGLHVPWNLQILPAKDNLSKGVKIF